jgi:hypothetical protein
LAVSIGAAFFGLRAFFAAAGFFGFDAFFAAFGFDAFFAAFGFDAFFAAFGFDAFFAFGFFALAIMLSAAAAAAASLRRIFFFFFLPKAPDFTIAANRARAAIWAGDAARRERFFAMSFSPGFER